MPVQFDTNRARVVVKDKGVNFTGTFSKETKQFIDNKYVVLRKFIPQDLIDLTLDTWKTIENDPEIYRATFVHEKEPIPNTPDQNLDTSVGCYCFPPAVGLHSWLKKELQKVLDFRIRETYSYSRKYVRGAYLRSHTDRPSCEVSATICLDYKSDDGTPWSIWVQNDKNYLGEADCQDHIYEVSQNHNQRQRLKNGAKKVDLEVGDVLLYQGPNIPHWRDEFLGEYSYHMFLHFWNATGQLTEMEGLVVENELNRLTGGVGRGKSLIDWDGRKDRYDRSEDHQEQYMEWISKIWNNTSAEDKCKFVNNYEKYEDNE